MTNQELLAIKHKAEDLAANVSTNRDSLQEAVWVLTELVASLATVLIELQNTKKGEAPMTLRTDCALYRTFYSHGFNRCFRHWVDSDGVAKYPGEIIGSSATLTGPEMIEQIAKPYALKRGERIL